MRYDKANEEGDFVNQKQRKRKWIGVAACLTLAGLFPASASSPNIPNFKNVNPSSTPCGRDKARSGSCAGGGDCCSGYPEASCDSGGGIPRV